MSCVVTVRNSTSSTNGTILMAGACTTVAPRRSSSAMNSSARRAAVTPTVKPVNGSATSDFDESIDHPDFVDRQDVVVVVEATPVDQGEDLFEQR